ncbi:MAG: hypothetical protein H6699_01575 [Myxococcales bacterium]|nr:hypothetical protein [Myxococcales bacterium]
MNENAAQSTSMDGRETVDAAALESGRAFLASTLGAAGWSVHRTRRGLRARRGMVTVTLKHRPETPDACWRARFNDGFPRFTVSEARGGSPVEALEAVVPKALVAARFFDGGLSLLRNPSKSWVAYRMWEAVRPEHG